MNIFNTLNQTLSIICLSLESVFDIFAEPSGYRNCLSNSDFILIYKCINELESLTSIENSNVSYEILLYSIRINIHALRTCVLTNITLSVNNNDIILYGPLLLSIDNYIKINDHLIKKFNNDSYDDDTVTVASANENQEEDEDN